MKLTEKEKVSIIESAPEGATHWCHDMYVIMNDEDKDSGWCKVWFEGKWMRNGYLSNCVRIEDLIPKTKEVEWENGLPPVGAKVMCSYTDTDCDGWCDMHGPSDVIAYHGDYVWIAHHGKFNRVHELCNVEFEKPESQEAKKEREELKAAYDLYCDWCKGSQYPKFSLDQFKDTLMDKETWLAIVRKTGYRVEK